MKDVGHDPQGATNVRYPAGKFVSRTAGVGRTRTVRPQKPECRCSGLLLADERPQPFPEPKRAGSTCLGKAAPALFKEYQADADHKCTAADDLQQEQRGVAPG